MFVKGNGVARSFDKQLDEPFNEACSTALTQLVLRMISRAQVRLLPDVRCVTAATAVISSLKLLASPVQ